MLDEILRDLKFGDFGPMEVLTNLLVALVLAIVTSFVYRHTHTGLSYSRSFNVTMVSVAMTITMIMMVIGNYLALSLGLVGALSVIRFRSAIKDPRDIAYLFLCIAIGLACSTGNYTISVIGTAIINATLYALHVLRFGAHDPSSYCVTFTLDTAQTDAGSLVARAAEKGLTVEFRSYAQIEDSRGEYVYSVEPGTVSEEDMIAFFSTEIPGLANLSLIAPETELEL